MRYSIFILFLFATNTAFSQDESRKYCAAIRYFKTEKTEGVDSMNVNPMIHYISSISFSSQLDSLTNVFLDTANKKELKLESVYFEPYLDAHLDSFYKRNSTFKKYLLLSKPVGDVLLVEVREGGYNTDGRRVPYFGTAIGYLFLFDKDNSIVQVLKDTIVYN